jgi:hypothetical protein
MLNAAKICENALKLAISRLQGSNGKISMVDEPGFEPGTSTMPTWRSCQTDLLAQSIWLLHFNSPRLIRISYGPYAKSLGSKIWIFIEEIGGAYLFIRQTQIEKPSKVQKECPKSKLH